MRFDIFVQHEGYELYLTTFNLMKTPLPKLIDVVLKKKK